MMIVVVCGFTFLCFNSWDAEAGIAFVCLITLLQSNSRYVWPHALFLSVSWLVGFRLLKTKW
jgi:hypothetical protein